MWPQRGLLPPISLGLWQNFGADRPYELSRAIVCRAFDLGVTHFDLANNYGPPYGSAERTFGQIIARSLRPYRDELLITTKAGCDMWPGPYGEWGSRKHLLASLDQSLQRMGLDYVDTFYSHRFDPNTPLEETMGALATGVKQGKQRTTSMRLRDLGIAIGDYSTGTQNAITDVAGVRVGHSTIISGQGTLVTGAGPVRTGVTVIEPRPGHARDQPCFAGSVTLNGSGEMTGLEWVRESGLLTTAIGLTNTDSVGVVRDALAARDYQRSSVPTFFSMPVVGETFDGTLNDTHGQHVRREHVFEAIDGVTSGPVAEGNVGGGTGMICHDFKGGIGTSSRKLSDDDGGWTVGVLVQANYGTRASLRVDGVPVGRLIPFEEIPSARPERDLSHVPELPEGSGSIIVIIATDAPLLPDQCRRLAMRGAVGVSRVGGSTVDRSGDFMFAFSVGNSDIPPEHFDVDVPTFSARSIPHQQLTPLFDMTSDATEEAILNALCAAEDMVGRDDRVAHALPTDRLKQIMDLTNDQRGRA